MIKRIINYIKRKTQSKKTKRHSMVGSGLFWKMKRDFQISFLLQMGLKQKNTVLDLGCGTLRGGIPIIKFLDQGNYWGIDVRKEVIEEAFKELREEKLTNKEPHIIHFLKFEDLQTVIKYDYILAFSVLFHLNDHVLEEAFEYVKNSLSQKGSFYVNAHLGEWNTGKWGEFPVQARTFEFYRLLAQKHGMEVKNLGTIKDFGHQSNYDQHDLQNMLSFTLVE